MPFVCSSFRDPLPGAGGAGAPARRQLRRGRAGSDARCPPSGSLRTQVRPGRRGHSGDVAQGGPEGGNVFDCHRSGSCSFLGVLVSGWIGGVCSDSCWESQGDHSRSPGGFTCSSPWTHLWPRQGGLGMLSAPGAARQLPAGSAGPFWALTALKSPARRTFPTWGTSSFSSSMGWQGRALPWVKHSRYWAPAEMWGAAVGKGEGKASEGKGREASPAGKRALLPPAPSSSCKLRRLRSCSGFLGSPIDAKAILEREGE